MKGCSSFLSPCWPSSIPGTSAGLCPGPRGRAGTTFAITGFVDNVTSFFPQHEHVRLQRGSHRRSQWYARTRGRFDIFGQVGPAKAVFGGSEIDSVWGQTGFIDSNNGPVRRRRGGKLRRSAALWPTVTSPRSTSTRHQGNFQVKCSTPSFPMPLVPFATIVRLGAQPFATAATYKLARVRPSGRLWRRELLHDLQPHLQAAADLRGDRWNLTGKPDFPPSSRLVVPVSATASGARTRRTRRRPASRRRAVTTSRSS